MDLTIELGHKKLNIRVAAWIEREDRILTVTFPDGNRSLPGGRVQFGETTEAAIHREIKEETGLVLLNAALFAMIENFFTYEGTPFHEYLYVYKGELDGEVASTNELEQTYHWMRREELHELKPTALQHLLTHNKAQICHVLHVD